MPTNLTGAPDGRTLHTAVWTGSEMIVWGGYSGSYLNSGGRYTPGTDSWIATNAGTAPAGRDYHTAVWTGSEMIVWGGRIDSGALQSGGRYAPGSDSWVATNTTTAPTGASFHTAVWTGSEMIVWGGYGGGYLNSGGRYTPGTDSWVATDTVTAPTRREFHTAVWTGTEMIVWGGDNDINLDNTGGRYSPATDTWVATNTATAPAARSRQTAVWTGTEMIVWGGDSHGSLSSGGRYTPGTDSWLATDMTAAPVARESHTAVWTGSEMIVWGGSSSVTGGSIFNSGGRYTPGTDSWVATSATAGPGPRYAHTAVWTGSEMIVWGGTDLSTTGGRYAPGTDSWVVTSAVAAPAPRYAHTAVWTGSEMIVWGGVDRGRSALNDGGRYAPGTDTWVATNTAAAPVPRYLHTVVWTGSEMIVWGGHDSSGVVSSGGRYTPGTDSWVATNMATAPAARYYHTAVWTGSEMVIWGGNNATYLSSLNSGGRYAPQTDSWVATSFATAPASRLLHTAVWTGREMIVWGGHDGNLHYFGDGGRYSPGTDSWQAVSTLTAPAARAQITAVWTGQEMIVWGGESASLSLDSGGRYAPASDSWTVMSAATVPFGRSSYTAVWTGSQMIVWGGYPGLDDGGLYCAGPNTPPVANPQSLTVSENGSLPITLTATDPDGDPLIYAIAGNPSHGSLSGTPPTVTYVATAGYFGPDSFTFKANDGRSDSNLATISLRVDAPPVASAQSLIVAENGSLPITLAASDPDGDTLTYAIVGSPVHGALGGTPPTVTYLPAAGYFGPDSFTFKANDGLSDSNVATVAIAVEPYGYLFYTVAPCRLFDSRSSAKPLLAGVEMVIPAGGLCGVPATARALAVNVTVVAPTTRGYLNLYATPGSPPPASVLDFAAGQVRANNAVVQSSQSGSFVALFTMSSGGKADLVVDVSGYFE